MFKTSKLLELSILFIFRIASNGVQAYQTPQSDPRSNAVIREAIQKSTGSHIVEPGLSISDDNAYKLPNSNFQKFSHFCSNPAAVNHADQGASSEQLHPIRNILPPLSEVLKEEMTANSPIHFVPPRAFRPRVKLGRDDTPTEYWCKYVHLSIFARLFLFYLELILFLIIIRM